MSMRPAVAALALLCLAPSVWADAAKKPAAFQVPYRLSDTNHLVVRAKVNGKGPFNLIVDTGAPALFLTKAAAKKANLVVDKNGWAACEQFELEGGLKIDKARARIEDVPQIEGMNALGAAGVELHGLLGYNLLAHFRIEYDLTRDKLTWTRVDHKPDMPERMGKGTPGGIEVLGSVLKLAGLLMGRRSEAEILTRGFLGVELAEGGGVSIQAVLPKSPAEAAGLLAGDRLTHFQDQAVSRLSDLYPQAAKVPAGGSVRLTILRGDATKHVSLTAGKGL